MAHTHAFLWILGFLLVHGSLARPPDENDYFHQEIVTRDHYYSYPDPLEIQTPLEPEGEEEVAPEPIVEVIHQSQDTREENYQLPKKEISKPKKITKKVEKSHLQKPGKFLYKVL